MTHTNTQVIYRQADLDTFASIIKGGADLWAKRCAEFMATRGDEGTCVIGADISVWYVAPRCRTVREHRIIDVPMTSGQGASTWEASVDEVLAFLRAHGIEAHYRSGRMD